MVASHRVLRKSRQSSSFALQALATAAAALLMAQPGLAQTDQPTGSTGSFGQNHPLPSPGSTYEFTPRGSGVGANMQPIYRGNDSVFQNFSAAPAITAPPPLACSTTNLTWTVGGVTCNSPIGSAFHNQALTLNDNVSPSLGQAKFLCSNGTYYEVAGQSACANEPGCPSQSMNWTVGSSSCDGITSAADSGGTTTANDTTGQTTGSASFSCSYGTLTLVNANCVTAPPASCSAGQSLSWSVGGVICDGLSTGTANNTTSTVNDTTAPNTGSATFSCTNGVFGFVSGSCTAAVTPPPPPSSPPPPPAASSCSTTTVSWVFNGNVCDGTATGTANGNSVNVSDSAGPTTGSASFVCNNGAFGVLSGSESCVAAPAPTASCSIGMGQTFNWGSTSPQCTYTFGSPLSIPSGGTTTAQDNAAPSVGSLTLACNNGMLSTASSSCNGGIPIDGDCRATSVAWSGAGGSCTSDISNTFNGDSRAVSSTNGIPGNATFACNAGAFQLQPGSTCGNAAPTPCYTFYQRWEDRDFRSGDDIFSSVGTFRMLCTGSSGPVSIEGALGNVFEHSYGVVYGGNADCTPPNCQPNIDQVSPTDRVRATLNDNESSLRMLGIGKLDTTPQWNVNSRAGYPVGTHSLWVLPGSGCSGTSCSYRFYSPEPGAYYYAFTDRDAPISTEAFRSGNAPWTYPAPGGSGEPPVKGFLQLCGSGVTGIISGSTTGENTLNYRYYASGLVNHAQVPAAATCYNPVAGSPATPVTPIATDGDGAATSCPAGSTLGGGRCQQCPPNTLLDFPNGSEPGVDNGGYMCRPAIGVTSPTIDNSRVLNVNFTRQ